MFYGVVDLNNEGEDYFKVIYRFILIDVKLCRILRIFYVYWLNIID